MVWTPFEVRFKDLLQRMSRHRGYVESELSFMVAWMNYKIKVTTDTERRLAAEEREMAARAQEHIASISTQSEDIKRLLEEQRESE